MRTIAVVNQKGGCGKTITAINLSAFLAMAGRRALLIDLDPQGHSTLGLSVSAPTRTMYDVFWSRNGGPDAHPTQGDRVPRMSTCRCELPWKPRTAFPV